MNEQHSRDANCNGWIGVALVAIGSILLLDRLDIIVIADLWKFWPVGLIAAGLVELYQRTVGAKS